MKKISGITAKNMAAVVRIKRRLDENPLETLVLNCKRRKPNGLEEKAEPEDLSAVLKLAGTSQKEEGIDRLLKKHHVAELKEQFKRRTVNISDKVRSDIKEASKNSRYRVVNCFRKTLNSDETDERQAASASTSEVTVFDIETDHNSNSNETSTIENIEDTSKYVYDFYYTSSDDFGEADIEEYVSVYPWDDPLIFGSVRDNGLDEHSEDDSEDSNAESNWKNDYPDEEDLESINDDDMIGAVKNLKIDEDLLSSDSGEEDLVYSRDEADFQDEEPEGDKEDELRYGKMYATFKAKHKNVETTGLANDFYYGDIDEDEYYY